MKTKFKKYPLLISTIVSCVIIIASLFILGFFGLRLGTSLGGGSQFEINMANGASSTEYVSGVKDVLKTYGLTFDSAIVEDKYVAIDNEGNFTTSVLVVKISQNNIADETKAAVIKSVATKIGVTEASVSSIQNITALATANNVLMLGLAVGIVAIALFVFAWIRYDIFAGISFIIAFLHNIILYLSLLILTRLELNLASLISAIILSFVMSVVLIHIYEKYRTESRFHVSDKLSISERMIGCEKQAVKPFVIIAAAVVVFAIFMLFVPATVVKFAALSILLALLVTAYTSLVVGPASYVALLEIREMRHKAVLSRNDTVNKEIKKKIKKSKEKAQRAENKEVVNIEPQKVEEEKEEEKPVVQEKKVVKKSSTTNKYATRKNTKKKK